MNNIFSNCMFVRQNINNANDLFLCDTGLYYTKPSEIHFLPFDFSDDTSFFEFYMNEDIELKFQNNYSVMDKFMLGFDYNDISYDYDLEEWLQCNFQQFLCFIEEKELVNSPGKSRVVVSY